jgi:hypothetical protein
MREGALPREMANSRHFAKSPLPDSNRRPLPYHGSPAMSSDARRRAKVPACMQESGSGIRPHSSAGFGILRYRVGTLTLSAGTSRHVSGGAVKPAHRSPSAASRRGIVCATRRARSMSRQRCAVALLESGNDLAAAHLGCGHMRVPVGSVDADRITAAQRGRRPRRWRIRDFPSSLHPDCTSRPAQRTAGARRGRSRDATDVCCPSLCEVVAPWPANCIRGVAPLSSALSTCWSLSRWRSLKQTGRRRSGRLFR